MVLILVASWSPDSKMTALRWVPGQLAIWADRDPNIRTAVPFVPLAFVLVYSFAKCNLKRPAVWAVGGCGVLLGLSEFGQTYLPHRTADVKDLIWGLAGIALGAVAAHFELRRNRSIKKERER